MSRKNYVEEERRKGRLAVRKAEETEAVAKLHSLVSSMADLFRGIDALINPEDLDRNSAYAVIGLCRLGSEVEKLFARQFEEYRTSLYEHMRKLAEEG